MQAEEKCVEGGGEGGPSTKHTRQEIVQGLVKVRVFYKRNRD